MSLRFIARLGLATVGLLGATSFAASAQFYLASDPVAANPNYLCPTMMREIPRQMILVAAAENLNIPCVDATVEPDAKPQPSDVEFTLFVTEHDHTVDIAVHDPHGAEVTDIKAGLPCTAKVLRDYEHYLADVQQPVNSTLLPILAQECGVKIVPPKWNPTAPAPNGIKDLLLQVDFQRAFLAARLTNQAITESGESPARLGALIRAYANLGEATRHLINGQSTAFFARGLVYADRLCRLAPDDPASYWHRAYVEALLGLPADATHDMQHADGIAKGANEPNWVDPLRDLIAYNTKSLFDNTGDIAPLSCYFAWLTVEHSPLTSISINFARLALAKNNGAVRAVCSMTDNTNDGPLRNQTTGMAPVLLNRLMSELSTESAAGKTVNDAASQALSARFSTDSILQFLGSLAAQPTEPGQLLPWSTYAAMVHDCQFTNAVYRLTYVAHDSDGRDPAPETAQWMPLLQKHRYAAFIASFDPANTNASAAVTNLNFKDDALAADALNEHLNALKMWNDRQNNDWLQRHDNQSDKTAYDLEQVIWTYRNEDPGKFADYLKDIAQSLLTVSPNDPIALANELINNYADVKDRTAEIQQQMSDNPLIAYALGRAYVLNGRANDAILLLKTAADLAPDEKVYRTIAELYLAKNDEAGWLKTWDEYLAKSQDPGLNHARVQVEISQQLARRKEHDKALPYAKAAADSGAGWALTNYAAELTALKQFDEANNVMQQSAQNYGGGDWYRWCRATGHGDLKQATDIIRPDIPSYEQNENPQGKCDAGVFLYLEGQPDQAETQWKAALNAQQHPFYAMLVALIQMERNEADYSKTLQAAANFSASNDRERAYAAGVAEMNRCLADPKLTPARDGEIGKLLGNPKMAAQAGNVCFCLGRFCELRGQKDQAKQWYRSALECGDTNYTCYALAAINLRQLGEDYFK